MQHDTLGTQYTILRIVGTKPTATTAAAPRGETFRESVRVRDGPGFDVAEARLTNRDSEQVRMELNEQ